MIILAYFYIFIIKYITAFPRYSSINKMNIVFRNLRPGMYFFIFSANFIRKQRVSLFWSLYNINCSVQERLFFENKKKTVIKLYKFIFLFLALFEKIKWPFCDYLVQKVVTASCALIQRGDIYVSYCVRESYKIDVRSVSAILLSKV